MSDPLKPVPSQIGSVTGADRMDTLDRQKLDYRTKLELLCQEMKAKLGRDPRSGGFAFVARPRVILQLLKDAHPGTLACEIQMERPVIAGRTGADVVGFWNGIPIIVRSSTVGDNLICIRVDKIPESHQVDRRRAGELRMAAHYNKLDVLVGDP